MTNRAPDNFRRRLVREHDALRVALVAHHALRAAAGCAALVVVAVLVGVPAPGGTALAWARLVLLAAASAVTLALALAALRRQLPRFDTWLEATEHRFPQARSWLRNAVDLEQQPDANTSPALADALRAEAAHRLDALPIAAARPRVGPRAPALVAAAAVAALALSAALAPQATLRSWRTLWRPALAAPPITLAVEPGSVTIAPGATLSVRARVAGASAAPQLTGDGPSPAPQLEAVERGVHRWRFDLPPVTRARDYAVRVQSARSPRYHIGLAGQPQPVSFTFTYRAPAYARLPEQSGASTSGDLAALRGSTADIEVTFDRDLESLRATLPDGRVAAWRAITPRRWRGQVAIAGDGDWRLRATAASGTGEWRWRVSALADAPPLITVVLPHGDEDLPSGTQVPYDVLAQDDLGLTDLRLQFRKDAAEAWHDVPLASFAGEPREARLTAAWDADVLALLPGQSGTFRFVLRDNDRVAGRASAVSPEFHVRFPSMAELYDQLDHRQENVQQSLNQVAEHARELQRSLDQLQRQQPKPGVTSPPQYERGEEMRKAMERQRDLARQLDRAASETRQSLADAAEREAFHEDLQQKLHEMSELMQQIQSQEFRDALQRMQKALESMDQSQMERELPRMREQNRTLLQNLDRSLALLRQMRDEERMESLARRADELKQRQDAMNRERDAQAQAPAKGGQSPAQREENAAHQQQAAQESRKLASDTHAAAQQSQSEEAKQDLEAAAQELEQQAATAQDQAAQQAQSGDNAQASRSGQSASQSLSRAGQRMRQGTSAAQRERDARQLAAVRRSAQDLVSLGREASQNVAQAPPPGQGDAQADRQTDLSEGVARVADSLAQLGHETPVLSPAVQKALGQAMQGLSRSARDMSQGNMAGGMKAGRDANSALAEAVRGLRDAETSMCNKPGPKPGQGQAMGPGERMSQLGESQQVLNERSRALAQRLSQAMRLTASDRDQLRHLADEQGRLRAELEQIQHDDEQKHQLLGRLDQARRDMQQVEEEMRQGNPGDDLEERQTRILSRLLDATRSINRRDYDPQREAVHADDIAHPSPAPLPASLLREDDQLRLDLMKADADRYPAQYRALIERYLQRLNGRPR